MKKTAGFFCVLFLIAIMLCGCRFIRIEEEERKPLEFTIVKPEELPREAVTMIDGKKNREFQMTYQVGEDLYLIKGYGRQMTGGYSIQAAEVSLSSNGIFFKTKLVGPSENNPGSEPSYPYIVVRIKYREEPVQFIL